MRQELRRPADAIPPASDIYKEETGILVLTLAAADNPVHTASKTREQHKALIHRPRRWVEIRFWVENNPSYRDGRWPARLMDNLPFWARVLIIVGLPTFPRLVNLGRDMGLLPSPLQSLPGIERELRAHAVQTTDEGKEVMRLLRQICRNVSKSDVTAATCEQR